ncbi:MAG: hypothetical protein WCD64_19390, partial [Pseudolabrys sp.]
TQYTEKISPLHAHPLDETILTAQTGPLIGAETSINAVSQCTAKVAVGSKGDLTAPKSYFRCAPNTGHCRPARPCRKSAKLGNGSRRKIALHCEPKAHFLLDPDRLSSRCPKAYLG